MKKEALQALEKMKDDRPVELIIDDLEDNNVWVRRRAVDSLIRTDDVRAIEPLAKALYDNDPQVRAGAESWLRKMGVENERAKRALQDYMDKLPKHWPFE